jgi:hypothetical protein
MLHAEFLLLDLRCKGLAIELIGNGDENSS